MTAAEWVAPALALLLIAAFGLTIRSWSDHLAPALATRVLLACSAAITAAAVLVLAMAAIPLLGRSDGLADGRWSEEVFTREPALGWTLRLLAVAALGVALFRVCRELRAQQRSVGLARSFRRSLGPTAGGIVVVPTDDLDALAVNGDFVLLTRGLIRCLDPEQRRAVLAHEQAHIDNRHHHYTRMAALLAATNPLLRRLPAAVAYLIERWADEEAARATSRVSVASALERAAHVGRPNDYPADRSIALAAALVAVERRISILRVEPAPRRPSGLLPPVALAATASAVAVLMAERTMDLFELAILLRRTAGR